ncbi:predicted protein [Nematostella vectensis]|uniref:Probable G-protein coupled receptor 19 n=1 Tax=Nematostella vectensis TaxID=45351 RepID=A7RMX9_NEMVE|nr:predicted protein [Nematostella vectensis]|eukprot:XP_001639290.1 predicted protein [Nematostella vectensis]
MAVSGNVSGNCSRVVSTANCPGTPEITLEVFFLIVIFIGALVGNVLILLVVRRSRRNEWTTNYFVTSLAVSNLTSPFLCVFWVLVWITSGKWLLGNISCKTTFFFHFLNVGVSAGLLACISLDRFYVVVHPLSFKMTKAQTKELIVFVWVFMICATAPSLYFFKTKSISNNNELIYCITDFDTVEWKVFITLLVLIPFGCPLITTLALYCRITQAILFRNRQAMNLTNDFRRQANQVPKSKIKVLRMLVIQWLVFVASWLPLLITMAVQALKLVDFSESLYIATLVISFANSGLNALIYSLFNGDFRRGCKRVFCKPDSSQAYRLTSIPRKNRIAPTLESFSSEHIEGYEMRLPELKPFKHYSLNGTADKQIHQAWVTNCIVARDSV